MKKICLLLIIHYSLFIAFCSLFIALYSLFIVHQSVLGQGIEQTVNGNNKFAFELYHKVFKNDKNIFLSPYSISSALAMTYAGARHETEKQMADVLSFDLKQLNTHKGFYDLDKRIDEIAKDGNVKLSVANCLWVKNAYPLAKDFIKMNRKYYRTPVYSMDSAGVTGINNWVAKATNNKINNIVNNADVANSILLLTNAIYFKGKWEHEFDKRITQKDTFYTTKKSKISVQMMNTNQSVNYTEDNKIQAIEMPYQGDNLSMIVILPKKNIRLEEIISSINNEAYQNYISKMTKQRIIVYLPKFKTESEFNLVEVLSGMGIKDAFKPNVADFSGMFRTKAKQCIGEVKHKAWVEVNEEGTEAAAATTIGMVGAVMHKDKPLVFKANHPFMYLIRDTKTGSILFLGTIINPNK